MNAPLLAAREGPNGSLRRWAEATGFVCAWIGLGVALHLRSRDYGLLGIPLTVGFQLLVRREPIRAAWVWKAPQFRPRVWAFGISALAAGASTYEWQLTHERHPVSAALSVGASLLGACGLAYSLPQMDGRAWRATLYWVLLMALPLSAFLVAAHLIAHPHAPPFGFRSAAVGVVTFAQYVTRGFALDEASFRGVLDRHVSRSSDTRLSAALLSMMWAVWQVPTFGTASDSMIVSRVLGQILVGLGLTYAMRGVRNLFAPVIIVALVCAVGDALPMRN